MVTVAGVAVLGPGLPGWAESQSVLRGAAEWHCADVTLPSPTILSATERRRTSPVVRLALAVATAATEMSGLPPATMRSVFGSSNGDGLTLGAILETLTQPDGMVSPTQFHNSVHNAAAGYWSIATRSRSPATCLGCNDWTFGASLMKAVAECVVERQPVLLCVYDIPLPPPLHATRPIGSVFGAALVLAPDGPGPQLALRWECAEATASRPLNPALLALAAGNPAARSLRLLEALAQGGPHSFDVPMMDGRLLVDVS
jgi:hypothetical protein